VIFLCETLVHANKIEDIRVRLGYDGAFAVDKIGRSGGLAYLWKHPFEGYLINYSTNFINLEIRNQHFPLWRFTGFYGIPDGERRRESWDLLRTLSQDNSLLWCVMGDFNDILSNEDKRGRVDHPSWRIQGFREAVQDSGLIDMPLHGYSYTWLRSRGEHDVVEERLDRAMATQSWLDLFPNSQLFNTVADRSDHSPIILKLLEQENNSYRRPFRFENAWLEEERLHEVVTTAWGRGSGFGVLESLNQCREDLERWGRQMRRRFRDDIDKCRNELEEMRAAEVPHELYMATRNKMSSLLIQEDAFWRQRAKVH
jgi:exonuclease III